MDSSAEQARVPHSSQVVPTPEQDQIVKAAPGDRLIVSAGPGTGKTAVACARVAFLIDHGIEPTNIWLISFTRTAVKEIRDRIYGYVGGKAYGIRIATLDQQAFQLVQGFTSSTDERIFHSYELNIQKAITLIQSGREEIIDFLGSLEHLVVDEAQDVVGQRAEMLVTLIRMLSPSCGVSVFGDEAQAIYGFSDDGGTKIGEKTLPEVLQTAEDLKFRTLHLHTIHRTSSDTLLAIFRDTRSVVLSAKLHGQEKLKQVRQDIERFCDSRLGQEFLAGIENRDDVLVLFRRRGEALKASTALTRSQILHRVRISRSPSCLHPWIGLVFWDYCEKRISRNDFEKRWGDRLGDGGGAGTSESIWGLLARYAGDGRDVVDVRVLWQVLSRPRPPIEFVAAEIGVRGPIVGTIHASKGREAAVVHLQLSSETPPDSDLDEEARVLFVGATRARLSLKLGEGYEWMRTLSDSGRAFNIDYRKKHPANAELGMDGDLDVLGQASHRFFTKADAVLHSQEVLKSLIGKQVFVKATADPDLGFVYRLRHGEDLIGHMSLDVNRDLFRIGKLMNSKMHLRPGPNIYDVPCLAVRSLVLAAENTGMQSLLPPFDESGIMLAPVICGFPTVMFFEYSKKKRGSR